MCFTPFHHISTYLNITDNIKNQQSLFAAEVARAKKLLDELSALSTDQKSFTIIDEAFKGTGGEAQDLSYWYAQQLVKYPNSICINATHYPKLVHLEKETGCYRNYKVEVIRQGPGKLIRRYKLERGYTLYNIAQDILIEQHLM
jgi:DNA mismatch repair ATPase MutS